MIAVKDLEEEIITFNEYIRTEFGIDSQHTKELLHLAEVMKSS